MRTHSRHQAFDEQFVGIRGFASVIEQAMDETNQGESAGPSNPSPDFSPSHLLKPRISPDSESTGSTNTVLCLEEDTKVETGKSASSSPDRI
jgi:hypothetical protein